MCVVITVKIRQIGFHFDLAVKLIPIIRSADVTRNLLFRQGLCDCSFMTSVFAGWVKPLWQTCFMMEMEFCGVGQQVFVKTNALFLFPYTLVKRWYTLSIYWSTPIALSLTLRINHIIPKHHQISSYSPLKEKQHTGTMWNIRLGFLMWHMETKLWWHFPSQVSLLFKPKERKRELAPMERTDNVAAGWRSHPVLVWRQQGVTTSPR